jgi:hypothetical protein
VIDDRYPQAAYTAFIAAPHAYLLEDLDAIMPFNSKGKKGQKVQGMDPRL